jgi:hypothetical protein
VVAEEAFGKAGLDDEHRASNFGGLMKRIANILTGLSLTVLFFAASAHAQFEQRMTANIPFEFTVGNVALPAGQYEFLNAGDNIVQVRGADRRTVFTLSSTSTQPNAFPEKSTLKFVNVDGHHVLVQIWNNLAGNGSEFLYGGTSEDLTKRLSIDSADTDRR